MALGGLFTPFSVTKTTFGPSNVRSIKLGDEVRLVFSATLTASVVDLQLVLEMVDPRVIEQVANFLKRDSFVNDLPLFKMLVFHFANCEVTTVTIFGAWCRFPRSMAINGGKG